jgi:hypothetical protein
VKATIDALQRGDGSPRSLEKFRSSGKIKRLDIGQAK